jgi:hypothetical protein
MLAAMCRPCLLPLLLLLLLAHPAAPQSCSCSGRGVCTPALQCACNEGWRGPTCAQRTCPQGSAWVGYGAGGTDDVHSVLAECSGVGTCNALTGRCACPPGFAGEACGVLACPVAGGLPCGGRGRCLSMAAAAAEGNGAGALALPHAASTYSGWEAQRVLGCACDSGWGGADCSQAQCLQGPDPLLAGAALPEVQTLACACEGGTAYCSGGGAFSVALGSRSGLVLASAVASAAEESASAAPGSGAAPGESVESVLSAVAPGAVASVHFSGGGAGACAPGGVTRVTFLASRGNVPPLVLGLGTLRDASAVLTAATQQDGTAERLPCSGRGTCTGGTCVCLPGFYASDGAGGAGPLLDCGSTTPPPGSGLPVVPLTKCPGSPPCSNRGWCDAGGGAFLCRCARGWFGPACQSRACPLGSAWWDQPHPSGSAHALAPCANRGTCQLDGTCLCYNGFTGACGVEAAAAAARAAARACPFFFAPANPLAASLFSP